MPKLLTQAEVDRYHDEGFAFPFRALSREEAADAVRRIEAFEADHGAEAQSVLVFKAHLPFRWLSDLIRHPRILDAVEDVIGPDILCWGASFFQKNAHDPRFVSWHQDSYYYGLEPPDTCTAWLALTPSSLESGCVRVLPGTQRDNQYIEFENTPTENNLLSRGQTIPDLDLTDAVPMTLDAGEFSLHHEGIVHGSDPNGSDQPRIGLSIHYISPAVRRTKYNASGSKPEAALVRGEDRFGHWAHEKRTTAEFDAEALARLADIGQAFVRRTRDGEAAE